MKYRKEVLIIGISTLVLSSLGISLILKKDQDIEKTGFITFWFDDGMQTTFDIAYPLLRRNDWPAVVAMIGDRSSAIEKYEGVDGVMSWEEASILQDKDGWEISNHSLTHSHLNEITDQGILEKEISKPLEIFKAKDLDVQSFTFPYGEQGRLPGQEIVKKGHPYWRSSIPGVNSVPAWKHLTAYFFNNDTTEEELEAWIMEAEEGGWLILGLHSTLRKPVTEWEHTPKQLRKLIKRIRESKLEVVIPSYMYDTYGYAEDNVPPQ